MESSSGKCMSDIVSKAASAVRAFLQKVGHAVDMKETYGNMKQLLDCLEYSKYGWHICSDLKIVALLMGLQLGYTNLMKNLVKAMDRNGSAFKYLYEKFPWLSEAKIKEGIFVGPQIHQLFIDEKLNYLLKGDEKKAWDAFRLVSTNFLGNVRTGNYKELVKDMLSMYHKLGSTMSLKIHFLHSHLECFPENCGM
ncbi:hypothetical protein P4O66_011490, partial [Electrophorus voltai]